MSNEEDERIVHENEETLLALEAFFRGLSNAVRTPDRRVRAVEAHPPGGDVGLPPPHEDVVVERAAPVRARKAFDALFGAA